jgi:RNA polymerase sigma factor (TIGR02999 family)
MDVHTEAEVDALLARVRTGDESARDQLVEKVYPHLRRIARGMMARERSSHTLGQTGSGLVNALWLRLLTSAGGRFDLSKIQNAQHLVRLASKNMREILVDYAREKNALKRGNPKQRVDIDEVFSLGATAPQHNAETLAINEALNQLEAAYPEHAYALELKYFGGLTIEEGAAAMGLTVITYRRYCEAAEEFVKRTLTPRQGRAK